MNRQDHFQSLISISGENDFEALALKVFQYQAANNKVYGDFIMRLGIKTESIKVVKDIPFLPAEIFKSHEVITGENKIEKIFTSSGTTRLQPARHFIKDLEFYDKVSGHIFTKMFGSLGDFMILALMPSPKERPDSSLIHMVNSFIQKSSVDGSGFCLDKDEELLSQLTSAHKSGKKTLLFGLTYALLDFSEKHPMDFPNLMVMETGGMKGQRREMVREEVHEKISVKFGVRSVCSEYGMSELLSQAYSKGEGRFRSPAWMKILIRDTYDPLEYVALNKTGGINIIDLANIDSCAFLATQDLGKLHEDGTFEVLGRFDEADVRGCNLMVL